MCGIVGYIGNKKASEILISGLEKLEYRGYDSAGVAIYDKGRIKTEKHKGRICVLKDSLVSSPIEGSIGIAHTRWATHGAPSDENSHPHTSTDGKIALVHNGIIENYMAIKEELIANGVTFSSQTDTEVVVHLISEYYKGDIFSAVYQAIGRLKGAYSLVIMCADEPDKIIAVRKDSPLVIGLGSNENFVASDIPAILEYTRDIYLMENGEVAILRANEVQVFDSGKNRIQKDIFKVTWNAQDATKGGYEHFMLKEIFEQPTAVVNTLRGRLSDEAQKVKLDDFTLSKEEFDQVDHIYIVACGTACYAGMIGKMMIEKLTRRHVSVSIASEFRYNDPLINEKTMFIAISQSGETADTLESLRLAKRKGAKVLAVTNVLGSSISRESDNVLYTWAGPEIAVASTKAYSTQIIAMYLIAIKLATLSSCPEEKIEELYSSLSIISKKTEQALKLAPIIEKIAQKFTKAEDAFYIGRGLDYCLALEGALKMKEISYIHAEAYQSGELKHGPIALIEAGTLVVALCTQQGEQLEKTLSNIKETKARGAYVIAIAQEGCESAADEADEVIYIEKCQNPAAIIPAAVVLQLLSYYSAKHRGCDIDKPKNLAKSVTVE